MTPGNSLRSFLGGLFHFPILIKKINFQDHVAFFDSAMTPGNSLMDKSDTGAALYHSELTSQLRAGHYGGSK